MHESITIDRRRRAALDDPGFCTACGREPDARRIRCEACGAFQVYGAEELLMRRLDDI